MQKILIVEDEPDIQEMLAAYLKDAGYETTEVGDGVEALTMFKKARYDLILLDLMLPKIDGFGVCELIRKESDIPVIMLTAMSDEAAQLKGFRLNIDDYVTKPFSMPVLLQKIRVVLRRSMGENYRGTGMRYRDLTLDPEAFGLLNGSLFAERPLALGVLDPVFSLPAGTVIVQCTIFALGAGLTVIKTGRRGRNRINTL